MAEKASLGGWPALLVPQTVWGRLEQAGGGAPPSGAPHAIAHAQATGRPIRNGGAAIAGGTMGAGAGRTAPPWGRRAADAATLLVRAADVARSPPACSPPTDHFPCPYPPLQVKLLSSDTQVRAHSSACCCRPRCSSAAAACSSHGSMPLRFSAGLMPPLAAPLLQTFEVDAEVAAQSVTIQNTIEGECSPRHGQPPWLRAWASHAAGPGWQL